MTDHDADDTAATGDEPMPSLGPSVRVPQSDRLPFGLPAGPGTVGPARLARFPADLSLRHALPGAVVLVTAVPPSQLPGEVGAAIYDCGRLLHRDGVPTILVWPPQAGIESAGAADQLERGGALLLGPVESAAPRLAASPEAAIAALAPEAVVTVGLHDFAGAARHHLRSATSILAVDPADAFDHRAADHDAVCAIDRLPEEVRGRLAVRPRTSESATGAMATTGALTALVLSDGTSEAAAATVAAAARIGLPVVVLERGDVRTTELACAERGVAAAVAGVDWQAPMAAAGALSEPTTDWIVVLGAGEAPEVTSSDLAADLSGLAGDGHGVSGGQASEIRLVRPAPAAVDLVGRPSEQVVPFLRIVEASA